jgi:transcriptional regulator with XRE-family HTH domain
MPSVLGRPARAPEAGVDKAAFGKRLRELRGAAGLSQKALADSAGVPQSQVSQWEAGNSTPLATSIPALAQALGVDPGELFKPAASQPEAPSRGRPPKAQEPRRRPPGQKR